MAIRTRCTRPVFATGPEVEAVMVKPAELAYSGDELTLHRTVTDKRESKSRPDMGIVTHHSRLINQKGLVVLESKIVLLVAKKP